MKFKILIGLICFVCFVASMGYSGTRTETELIVFSNNVTLGATTKLSDSGIAWDDMLGPARITVVGGAEVTVNDALGGLAFSTSSSTNQNQDHVTFTYQTPHRRKSNTELHPHVHFWQTNSDQTNCWYITYSFVGLGATNIPEVQVGPASNELPYVVGTMHQLSEFPAIVNTNSGISSIVRIKLFRLGTRGTGSITVTDLDCHYVVDGFGSDGEVSKSY